MNETNLLLAAARALEKINEQLDKTDFAFTGTPDIRIIQRDGRPVLHFRLILEKPLQPASSESKALLDSGKDAASISDSDAVNCLRNSQ